MTITKINYEQLFPTGSYQNAKLGIEIQIQDGDVMGDAYKTAHKIVNENFNKLFPPPPETITVRLPDDNDTEMQGAGANGYGAQVPQKQSAEQRMINSINSCTEIKVLETYKLLVKNNPVFQQAYDKKLEALTK